MEHGARVGFALRHLLSLASMWPLFLVERTPLCELSSGTTHVMIATFPFSQTTTHILLVFGRRHAPWPPVFVGAAGYLPNYRCNRLNGSGAIIKHRWKLFRVCEVAGRRSSIEVLPLCSLAHGSRYSHSRLHAP
ncbi:hypothetical protein EJ06DRAFT_367348 [Trichodelitschia bisporula]|uniref:Secreted protein n=1 Tax=Trichodelitschia bisporula TaxID=703511 RepID=A0A6G1I1G1_9PEZI|nr:hypothetical protein EJ06DRAFT_367348 [Trichodelitschia bisporula]